MQTANEVCAHAKVECLNQHELIRKYRCLSCGAVMMCRCDEKFGRRFLSHQLDVGTELKTQRRVPVTHGFQPNICAECRNEPLEAHPAAQIYGRTTKIKRYYWRELFFEETTLAADWDEQNPNATTNERLAAHNATKEAALKKIKELHKKSPKYDMSEPSQAEIIKEQNIGVLDLYAQYTDKPEKGKAILWDGKAISPEEFVCQHLKSEGWCVEKLESTPLHALFGVFLWLLIQDVTDPMNRIVCFGRRDNWSNSKFDVNLIQTFLPEDFGCEGYAQRREAEITEHLNWISEHKDDLIWLFDYWIGGSSDLRQYLWAHRAEDLNKARLLLTIMEPMKIIEILQYLLNDYWHHYLGWPDLIAYREDDYLLVEVKSSNDKLSNDQKRWIINNRNCLHLPFAIAKLHKMST